MLCYAMLCYAMLCYAMLCYAMLCYAMLYYTILVRPTLEYASAVCDLYTTTQTASLIISETNRTVKRHIITCKQLCHVNLACSSPVIIAF